MLDKYDIEKIKDGKFYSESHKCFVEIIGHIFTLPGRTINLDTVSIVDTETQDLLYNLIRESETKCRLEKRKSHAFGKDIFLLGKNAEGKLVWLEAPKWDCEWYWGFGYIEVYTNSNNPERARDIQSHSHFSGLVGQQEYYDYEKSCYRKGKYIHNVYDSPELVETTFTEKQGWELSELFAEFYLLQKMAEYTHRSPASCNLTTSPVTQDAEKMKLWHEDINKIMIPKITAKVIEMLTP